MQGFLNLADAIGNAITIILPALCYIIGSSLFILGGYGLWQSAKPGSYWAGHKYLPFLALFIASCFLSFDRILNKAEASFGGSVQFGLTSQITSYTSSTAPGVLGTTPEATVLNLVIMFVGFFIPFGALMVFLAGNKVYAVGKGERRGGYSGPAIQLIFGLGLINIVTVTQWIMTNFS
ncbi:MULTISPECIES: hypothetical protein [Acidiphilium]|uniref:Uncharacterized protein n=1 Tax=Acidiphilium rubrum TaxID=526 RepID=A0A8G2FEH7_ACIRU|nr:MULTISPECIES: hypothetical protein [Acidiphilium]SIR29613.1 hypothetical protein SAMN05421828_12333 [Acidiphilium rubrum]